MRRRLLILPSLLLAICLPLTKGQATAVGVPVPKPTATGQSITSSASAPFTWTPVTLPYGLNGTGQMAVGGTVDATSRLSVNPQGTAENGLTIKMPSGATGNSFQIKDSTNNTNAYFDVRGSLNIYPGNSQTSPTYIGTYLPGGSTSFRIQMNGVYDGLQDSINQKMQLYSYFGMELCGDMQGATSYTAQNPADTAVTVRGFQAGNPILAIKAASGQTADLMDFTNIGGTNLAKVTASGGITNTGYHTLTALATPTAPTFTTAATGGTLLASTTYYYRIVAVSGTGVTLGSTEASLATAAGTATNTLTLTWAAVTGAESYKVYGRTTGTELLIASGITALTYTDTGSITPAGALPTVNTTGYVNSILYQANGVSGVTATLADGSAVTGGIVTSVPTTILGNGSQVTVGGTIDATSRLSVNPQAAAENGLTVNMPSAPTGNGIQVKNSTGTTIAKVTAIGSALFNGGITNTGYHTLIALATPTAPTFTTAATGGTLLASTTYYYRIVAVSGIGVTLGSTEASLATAAGTTTNTVTLNWIATTGAESYNVYGRTTGTELLIASGLTALTYTDTGSVTPAGALPAVNTTGYVNSALYQANGVTFVGATGVATFPAVLTATVTKTAPYTLTATDTTILMNGAFAVTLPAASAALAGHSWTVKQIGAVSSTLVGTIDGNTSGYTLAARYNFCTIVCDGTAFYIVGKG